MPRKVRKTDSGLRWGEGYVEPRSTSGGEERFVARWPEGEGRDRKWPGKTFRTLDEAEDHLRDVMRKKRDGKYRTSTDMTVSECVREYMERRRSDWSPNTFGTMEVFRVRAIDPYLGKKRIASLDVHEIQVWLDTLARSGKRSSKGKVLGGLSRSAISNTRSLLSGALNDAARFGLIATNPAISTRSGGKKARERPTWSEEEVGRVLAATADNPLLHAMYCLALLTGMRPGEVRALHWHEVGTSKATIGVRFTMTKDEGHREYVGSTTKTGESRLVKVSPELIEILQSYRKTQTERRLAHAAWHDDDIVFDRGDGRFIPQVTMQRWHRDTIAAAKVSTIRLHDLRHTYASLQADAAINPRVVMSALGHKEMSMTMRYTHASAEMQEIAADTISRRVLGDRTSS